jgi:hypothetical protein
LSSYEGLDGLDLGCCFGEDMVITGVLSKLRSDYFSIHLGDSPLKERIIGEVISGTLDSD